VSWAAGKLGRAKQAGGLVRLPGPGRREGELGWVGNREGQSWGVVLFFFKPFQTFKLNYKHFKSFQD
jgi:hypothetical protein